MRSKIILLALCSAVAGCHTPDLADKGVAAVNVPVVSTTNYVFDAAAPDGALAQGELDRLSGWFQGLGLSYGDSIYVDGANTDAARGQVAAVAGQYGMMVTPSAPVTSGEIQPGSVRVIVARRSASVPNCPNWSLPSQPNYDNRNMSNFGCGVNSDIAMQVANPEDLVHGQQGSVAVDALAGAKAIQMYRNWPLTGIAPGQSLRPLIDVEDKTTGGGK